jgi:RimJ/RimL family protein N-acetyltransferase
MLKGRLVSLRGPREDDYTRIAEWAAPTSLTAAFTGGLDDQPTAEDVRQLVHSRTRRYLMIDLPDGRTVGTVDYARSGSAGCYCIGGAVGTPDMWQRGYGAEAFVILFDHLFQMRNAHRVEFSTSLFNRNVVRMAIRAGCVCEGVRRQAIFLDGGWHDIVLWSVLRDEFYAGYRDDERPVHLRYPDLIPEAEKASARAALADYLQAAHGQTSLAPFLGDRGAAVR